MGREEQLIEERKRKIEELKKQGVNSYPTRFDKKEDIQECLKLKISSKVKTAGRLMTKRELGRIAFAKLRDSSGDIQLVFQEGETPEKAKVFFKKYIDEGDFVGVEGEIFKTKTNEISILVKDITLLTKSILPLPEKFHGLQDDEERLRKRYLEIIMDPEISKMVERKSKFWQTIRQFLLDKGFMEVETPVLENTPGGAEAKPFITHHNALDLDVYLRISPELWLKRLMVAGYPKVFEIGRIFRNEGMDAEHLQDYTQMEFYWAYADYNDGMKLMEEMFKHVAKETFGTLKFKIKGFDIDLGKKWEIYDFCEIIIKMTGIDVLKADIKAIEKKLKELDVEYDRKGFNINRGVDNLWKYCRKKIGGPGFLINVPVFMEPLAKRMEKNPELVERYQIILAGSELAKGFSELNDPIDQLERFEAQQKLREQGDEEAQMKDDEFVEALKYGMPPTTGLGISERLFSFLVDKPVRECVTFPLMRPREVKKEDGTKEMKAAIAIINKGAKMERWQEMNTIAHLNAAFGARKGKELFLQDEAETKEGKKIRLNIQHAIMIKEINSSKEINDLIEEAKKARLEVSEFTREMMQTTNDKKVVAEIKQKNREAIENLGVLIFGKKSEVERLTANLKLIK